MRFAQLWSMMAVVVAFGGVGLASQTASAVCCDAPICLQEEPPIICNWCVECLAVEQMSIVPELVYDENEGLCYETTAAEPVPCDGGRALE
jgi:hypothetical protein